MFAVSVSTASAKVTTIKNKSNTVSYNEEALESTIANEPTDQSSVDSVTPPMDPLLLTETNHAFDSNNLIYHDIVTNGEEDNHPKDYGFDFPTHPHDSFDSFDSPDYVLGQNAMDYGRGYAFGTGADAWNSVTMVDGNLEPLEEEIPYFDDDSPTHVTAAVGAPAHIPCMVRNLGSKSVST